MRTTKDLDSWREIPFGEFATLQRGFDLPLQSRKDGTVPIIASTEIVGRHDEARAKAPGVVTGRSGSIGDVRFVREDYWPLNTTLYVSDFHGNDPEFVSVFMEWFDLARFASGTGVPTLNRNDVHPTLVRVPTPNLQRRIVSVLHTWDQAIEQAKRYTETLDLRLKHLRETLTSASDDSKRITVTLGQISSLITSGSRGWAKYNAPSGAAFLGVGNLPTSGIRLLREQLRYVRLPDNAAEGLRTKIETGDILVSITADLGRIGYAADESLGEAYVNQHIALVRTSDEAVVSEYVAYSLASEVNRQRLLSRNDAGAKAGLNLRAISEFPIKLPCLSRQRRVVDVLRACDEAVSLAKRQRELFTAQKAALANKLLSGALLPGGATTNEIQAAAQ